MSQKQDRINDVLAQRISQLEDELLAAQNSAASALSQKDRLEEEMKFLKAEVFEVVEQWSAENTELRRKLGDAQKEAAADRAAAQNRDQMVLCLKEELRVAQQLSTQYTTELAEVKRELEELCAIRTELTESLSTARANASASSQQVADYERLVAKFQTELKSMLTARKDDAETIDRLRESLTQAAAENRVLRDAGASVSSSTERLLEKVTRMKEENEALQNRRDEALAATAELTAKYQRQQDALVEQEREIERLAGRASAADGEILQLRERCESAEAKLEKAATELAESTSAAAQQLQLIVTLESDIQELRDGSITAAKMIGDLQAELISVQQQRDDAARAREDLETEHGAVKESYATLLMELDDEKRRTTCTIAALQAEVADLKRDWAERCALAEQRCDSAWSSVQDLTAALHAQQLSHGVQKEQLSRSAILTEQQASFNSLTEALLHSATAQLGRCRVQLEATEVRLAAAESNAAKLENQLSVALTRCRASEQVVTEHRKALSALESQLSHSTVRLKEMTAERDACLTDNSWLRSQVESMRVELGELDELLNANLNEMREENERLQVDNETLKQKLSEAGASEGATSAKAAALESCVAGLEGELRAQTKTLELTEAELQALKAQVENLSTSLDVSKKRAEELQGINADMERVNAGLTAQVAQLHERLSGQDAKLSLVLADRRKESESLKLKVNAYAEKYERSEQQLQSESKARKELESSVMTTREQNTKLRSALDELKSRCASDAAALKELLTERDDLLHDRDLIVEKYNKLHDAFRGVRREAHGKVAEELKKTMELAVSQEAELQTLRRQNVTLKKSVAMFVESAQPKAEAVFMERLNLAEGPLRHPKKRTATSASDPQ